VNKVQEYRRSRNNSEGYANKVQEHRTSRNNSEG